MLFYADCNVFQSMFFQIVLAPRRRWLKTTMAELKFDEPESYAEQEPMHEVGHLLFIGRIKTIKADGLDGLEISNSDLQYQMSQVANLECFFICFSFLAELSVFVCVCHQAKGLPPKNFAGPKTTYPKPVFCTFTIF